MEDPGITRLNIDHYRRLLKLAPDDVTRQETLALLAEAEARLSSRLTREQWERPIGSESAAAPAKSDTEKSTVPGPALASEIPPQSIETGAGSVAAREE